MDKFFTSAWKRGPSPQMHQRALHKRTWPGQTHYQPSQETMQLWMKQDGGEWVHVRNLAPEESRKELLAWRENNPGWQFGLKEKEKAVQSKPKKLPYERQ